MLVLSDGVGIYDPCEKETVDVTENLTPQQREDLTLAAQVTHCDIYLQPACHTVVQLRCFRHCLGS